MTKQISFETILFIIKSNKNVYKETNGKLVSNSLWVVCKL